jgi:phosphoserine aminotransferase
VYILLPVCEVTLDCFYVGPLEVCIFLKFAGHLSNYLVFAGIRVSLYNAVTEEQTDKLVAYIREFVEKEVAVGAGPALLEVDEQ